MIFHNSYLLILINRGLFLFTCFHIKKHSKKSLTSWKTSFKKGQSCQTDAFKAKIHFYIKLYLRTEPFSFFEKIAKKTFGLIWLERKCMQSMLYGNTLGRWCWLKTTTRVIPRPSHSHESKVKIQFFVKVSVTISISKYMIVSVV